MRGAHDAPMHAITARDVVYFLLERCDAVRTDGSSERSSAHQCERGDGHNDDTYGETTRSEEEGKEGRQETPSLTADPHAAAICAVTCGDPRVHPRSISEGVGYRLEIISITIVIA